MTQYSIIAMWLAWYVYMVQNHEMAKPCMKCTAVLMHACLLVYVMHSCSLYYMILTIIRVLWWS